MSIVSEIERIKENIANAYTACDMKGAILPEVLNSDNLATSISSIGTNEEKYRTMTVLIDTTNSNPNTCCSYADDAVNMAVGSSEWDTFFGHKPCLFKNGEVVKYLNPNDYTKDVDGNDVDITSGDAGDVMIEFPLRGKSILLPKYINQSISPQPHPRTGNLRDDCAVPGNVCNVQWFSLSNRRS